MTRPIELEFDAVANRWTVAAAGDRDRYRLVGVRPGLAFARDDSGLVREIVIDLGEHDAAILESDTLDIVRTAFGDEAAQILAGVVPTADHTTTVEGSTPPRLPAALGSPAIGGEPGRPSAIADGGFVVPTGNGELELTVVGSELRILVPRPLIGAARWVVVSDSTTGDLLATAPLLPQVEGGAHAEVLFGIDRPTSSLHVSLVGSPAAAVGDRRSRLRAWADAELAAAHGHLRFRPWRARAAAAHARDAFAELHDPVGVSQADRATKRARRTMRLIGLLGILLLAAVTFSVAALGFDDDTSPATVFYEDCDAARAGGPTPLHPGDPGYRPELDRDSDGLACEG